MKVRKRSLTVRSKPRACHCDYCVSGYHIGTECIRLSKQGPIIKYILAPLATKRSTTSMSSVSPRQILIPQMVEDLKEARCWEPGLNKAHSFNQECGSNYPFRRYVSLYTTASRRYHLVCSRLAIFSRYLVLLVSLKKKKGAVKSVASHKSSAF